MKRLLSWLLMLSLLLGMIPAVHAEEVPQSVDRCCSTPSASARTRISRPTFEGKLYEVTPQRVEDTFRYLDEFYIETHPEAALMVNTADEEDRQVLKKLADIITADCTTDRQKADAIADWVERNIVYDVYTSAYANDTFYTRTGNCLSYANLMQYLMRLVGIPAVIGDGWRGDMKENTVELFNRDGHAWCFAYVDGEWLLYDPLWLDEPTTDREYMARWIYFDKVEYVCPVYDEDHLPPEAYDKSKAYYTDGRVYVYSDFLGDTTGVLTDFINNLAVAFVTNQNEPEWGGSDGMYDLDGAMDMSQMRRGECYRNGWYSYGDYKENMHMMLCYALPNGAMVDGVVLEYDGVDRFQYTNTSYPVLADPADYSIRNGLFSLPSGYCGPWLGMQWSEKLEEGCRIEIENKNPEVAVMHPDGTVECIAEGYAEIWVMLIREEDDAYLSTTIMELDVSDEPRVPDYSDVGSAEPEIPDEPEVPDTPEEPGFTDLAPGAFYLEPVAWAVETGVTNGMTPTTFAPGEHCSRAQVVTFLWRAAGKPVTTARSSAFSDVKEGKFYTDAVKWAVDSGVTNGMGDGTFGVDRVCSRAQVVTFLWRAAGKPTPKSAQCDFTDVKAGSFYYDAVLWAVEEGITNGMGDGTFGVDGECTRGQIVTFLWRYVHR